MTSSLRDRHTKASGVRWRAMSVGALAALAYLLPFLGRSFGAVALIHPRLLSYGAIAGAIFLATTLRPRPRSAATQWITATLIALFLLTLAVFPWNQEFWILTDRTLPRFYAGAKMTRFIVTSVPLIVLAVVVSPLVHSRRFTSGMIAGTLFAGTMAGYQILRFRSLLNDPLFFDLAGFSTIGLATIFVLCIVAMAAWYVASPTLRISLGLAFVSTLSLSAIFLLSQRTPFAIGLGVIAFALWRASGTRRSSLAYGVVAMVLIAMIATFVIQTVDIPSAYPNQLNRYTVYLGSDDASAQARWVAWAYAWAEGFHAPFSGHGMGSFALVFPELLFPHNLYLEIHYEVGLIGGLMVLFLLGIAIRSGWRTMRSGEFDFYLFGLVTMTVMAVKGTTFEQLGLWAFWLYLCTEAAFETGDPREESSPLLDEPPF